MNDTGDFTLVHRSYRYHQASITHRWRHVALQKAVADGCGYDPAHGGVYAGSRRRHRMSYPGKLRRRRILYFAMPVDDAVDCRGNSRKWQQITRHGIQKRIWRNRSRITFGILFAQFSEECRDFRHCAEGCPQGRQIALGGKTAWNPERRQHSPAIADAGNGKTVVAAYKRQHFRRRAKKHAHSGRVGAETHGIDPLHAQGRNTMRLHRRTHPLESYFPFDTFGIYHITCASGVQALSCRRVPLYSVVCRIPFCHALCLQQASPDPCR